jgi:hypothetical protein
MCSKCARDAGPAEASSPRPIIAAASPSPPAAVAAATAAFASPPKPSASTSSAAAAAASPVPASPAPTAGVTPSASPSVAGAASAAGDGGMSPSRPQKRKDRCYLKGCKTKLSMMDQQTNKCMCGFVFCVKHRHAEEHQCTADHLGAGRAKIAKANERVVSDKVHNRC